MIRSLQKRREIQLAFVDLADKYGAIEVAEIVTGFVCILLERANPSRKTIEAIRRARENFIKKELKQYPDVDNCN